MSGIVRRIDRKAVRSLSHANVLVSALRVTHWRKQHGCGVGRQGIDGAVGLDGKDWLLPIVRIGYNRGVRAGQCKINHLADRCRIEKRGAIYAEGKVRVGRFLALLKLKGLTKRSLVKTMVKAPGQLW